MNTLRSSKFWVGFAVGVVIGPMVLGKVAPGIKAKLPS